MPDSKPPAAKRHKAGHGNPTVALEPAPLKADLTALPQELLLLIVGYLSPRECRGLRLTCKLMRNLVDANVASTLTVTNSIAQYVLLAESHRYTAGNHNPGNGWVSQLLLKFPRITNMDVKCSQPVLTLFARHLVRDCAQGKIPMDTVIMLADNVKTNSRRHSAVLLCELLKLRVSEAVPAPRQLHGPIYKAEQAQLMNDYRLEAPARVLELVDRVLVLKGHAEARAHEHYKYARDTLDDSLLQLVSCLQPRHSRFAYQLLAKAADPAKAARGWRWLFYFLARQKQAEHAIEAYKVVDKQALLQLSPTCLSELFRALIDNEISTQPENKLRAITSESGSWTKFLYRGAFNLTSVQSREGALEKVVADLINKDYLDTAVNVMNRFESEHTAAEVWTQILGALGMSAGGEMPLLPKELHKAVLDQVERAKKLLQQVAPMRRTAGHAPLLELLVAEGHFTEAAELCQSYGEQGVLDKYLLKALMSNLALDQLPPEDLSGDTCKLLRGLLDNNMRDVAAKVELTRLLVRAYAARGDLQGAVKLASVLDPPMVAAAVAAAAEAAAGAEAVAPPAGPPAVAAGAAGAAAAAAAAGLAPLQGAALPTAEAAEAAEQQLATMWQGLASTALLRDDVGAFIDVMEFMKPAWLLAPVASATEPSDEAETTAAAEGAGGQHDDEDAAAAVAAAGPGPAAANAAAPLAAADLGSGVLLQPTQLPSAASTAAAAGNSRGGRAKPADADASSRLDEDAEETAPSTLPSAAFELCCRPYKLQPTSIWEAGCELLLRTCHEQAAHDAVQQRLRQLLQAAPDEPEPQPGETHVQAAARVKRQLHDRRAQAKALLESTAAAMVATGRFKLAIKLAHQDSVPCWPLLNIVLPAIAAASASGADAPAASSSRAGGGDMEVVLDALYSAAAKCQPPPGAEQDAAGPSRRGASTLADAGQGGNSSNKRPRRSASAQLATASADEDDEDGGGSDEEADEDVIVIDDADKEGVAESVGEARAGAGGGGGGAAPTADEDVDLAGDMEEMPRAAEGGGADAADEQAAAAPAAAPAPAPLRPWEGAPRRGLVADVINYLLSYNRHTDALELLQRVYGISSVSNSCSGSDGAGAREDDRAVVGGANTSVTAAAAGRPPRPQSAPRGGRRAAGWKRIRMHGDEHDAELGPGGLSRLGGSSGAAAWHGVLYDGPAGLGAEDVLREREALETALGSLVKALQKGRGNAGGGAGPSTSMTSGCDTNSLADCLTVCRAWPPGPKRAQQADALARRALSKDLNVALQAAEMIMDESQPQAQPLEPQEKKIAFTYRDLAQKCIAQGRLDSALACLQRISPLHKESVADATIKELIRAHAKAGNRQKATRLADLHVADAAQRSELLKSVKPKVKAARGKGTSRGSSKDR